MPKNDCFVSVVTSVSNDADTIDAFVRRVSDVVSASYENYEIVVIDDGSTDDTKQVM